MFELLVPISPFDPEVAELCKNPPAYVRLVKESEDIYDFCGPDATACLVGSIIYVPEGRMCPKNLAHELNHKQGNHWVDGPKLKR